MINVDDWAEIRRLYFAEQMGIKSIARQLGVARNTVRSAVRGSASDQPFWWQPCHSGVAVLDAGSSEPGQRSGHLAK